jgi:hypothetical protein
VVDYFRIRVMPVLGTSPAMFGQSMASYILCALAGKQRYCGVSQLKVESGDSQWQL